MHFVGGLSCALGLQNTAGQPLRDAARTCFEPASPVRADVRRSVGVAAQRTRGERSYHPLTGSSLSGRPDLNRGPHRPERCALPGCATPRLTAAVSHSDAVRYRAEPMALLHEMLAITALWWTWHTRLIFSIRSVLMPR